MKSWPYDPSQAVLVTVVLSEPSEVREQTLWISDNSSSLHPTEFPTHRIISKYDHYFYVSKFGEIYVHIYLKLVPEVWNCLNRKSKTYPLALGWWQRPEGQWGSHWKTKNLVRKLLLEAIIKEHGVIGWWKVGKTVACGDVENIKCT